jgi:hypothetical protein
MRSAAFAVEAAFVFSGIQDQLQIDQNPFKFI